MLKSSIFTHSFTAIGISLSALSISPVSASFASKPTFSDVDSRAGTATPTSIADSCDTQSMKSRKSARSGYSTMSMKGAVRPLDSFSESTVSKEDFAAIKRSIRYARNDISTLQTKLSETQTTISDLRESIDPLWSENLTISEQDETKPDCLTSTLPVAPDTVTLPENPNVKSMTAASMKAFIKTLTPMDEHRNNLQQHHAVLLDLSLKLTTLRDKLQLDVRIKAEKEAQLKAEEEAQLKAEEEEAQLKAEEEAQLKTKIEGSKLYKVVLFRFNLDKDTQKTQLPADHPYLLALSSQIAEQKETGARLVYELPLEHKCVTDLDRLNFDKLTSNMEMVKKSSFLNVAPTPRATLSGNSSSGAKTIRLTNPQKKTQDNNKKCPC